MTASAGLTREQLRDDVGGVVVDIVPVPWGTHMAYLTVGKVARELGVKPTVVSSLIYRRVVDVDRCPVVRGRRAIPRDLVPQIADELRSRGLLPAPVEVAG
jgi:hypothetical protein